MRAHPVFTSLTATILFSMAPLPWFRGADASEGAPGQRPNILLIITDQQHAGMMRCAGNPYVQTPALDGLAARGVRFERAYCANPVCVPSRFSMMTGVLPSRIGMETNGRPALPLNDEVLDHSLGRVFRDAGYNTVYGGKVHLPGAYNQGATLYGFTPLTEDEREGLAESCVKFFQQDHQKPFLLVASFINPHDICMMAIDAYTRANNLPEKYPNLVRDRQCLAEALELPASTSRDKFFAEICPPLPENFEITKGEPSAMRVPDRDFSEFRRYVQQNWSDEEWRLHRWAYARLTERVDKHVGCVLDGLSEAGLEKNTVVVFTSDHGDMDSAHRLEHKSMPYEEAARVPLIVSFPNATKSGHVDKTHLVSTGLDLIPTLCDFAGIATPLALAGRSVKPLAVAPDAQHFWRDTLVVENLGSRILCSERFKYTVYDHGQPREMLTDLENDPGEMTNLAIDLHYRETLAEHRQLLRTWYRQNGHELDGVYTQQSGRE